ncbi:MAG: PKD domain-containing protein [Desulfobacterota bacterium]|nr:PKD domain-containing protein [Thermodesulfobacteriota bacterium]
MKCKRYTMYVLAAFLFGLYAASAAAQEWEQMDSPVTTPLKGIWGTGSDNIYAVGSGGVILHYDGTAWSRVQNVPVSENLTAIHGNAASNIVAVGEKGVLVQYNGSTWAKRTVTTGHNLNAVWVASSSRMFIAGENGLILDCDRTTCEQSNYITSYSFNSIWASSENDVYIVGGGGMIIHFDGTRWLPMESGTTDILYSIWGAGASNIYAAGENGAVRYYNGTAWSAAKVVKRNYYAIGGIASPFRVYIASDSGKISYSEGDSWNDMTTPTTKALQAIWVSQRHEAYIVGAGGVILRYTGETLPENTAPQAAFSVTVSTDDPLTVYVDASASSDIQTPADKLTVQWDWESDGNYDTTYSATKVASHTYTAPGRYTITLRVRDDEGLSATASKEVVLEMQQPSCPAEQLVADQPHKLAALRTFRDHVLARTETGRFLIRLYYRYSDAVDDVVQRHPLVAAGLSAALEILLSAIEHTNHNQ